MGVIGGKYEGSEGNWPRSLSLFRKHSRFASLCCILICICICIYTQDLPDCQTVSTKWQYKRGEVFVGGQRWKHHLFDLLANNSSFMHFPISLSRNYVDRRSLMQTNSKVQYSEFVKSWKREKLLKCFESLQGWSNRKTNRKVCIKHKRNNLTQTLYLSFLFKTDFTGQSKEAKITTTNCFNKISN